MPHYDPVTTKNLVFFLNATSEEGRNRDGVEVASTVRDLSPNPASPSRAFPLQLTFRASALNGRGGVNGNPIAFGRPAKLEALHRSTSPGWTRIFVAETRRANEYQSFFGRGKEAGSRYSVWDSTQCLDVYRGIKSGTIPTTAARWGREPRIIVERFTARAPGSSTGTLRLYCDGLLAHDALVTLGDIDPAGEWIVGNDNLVLQDFRLMNNRGAAWGMDLIWNLPLSDAAIVAELARLREFFGIARMPARKAVVITSGNSIAIGEGAGIEGSLFGRLQEALRDVQTGVMQGQSGIAWGSVKDWAKDIAMGMRPGKLNLVCLYEHTNTLTAKTGSGQETYNAMSAAIKAIRAAVPSGCTAKIITTTAVARTQGNNVSAYEAERADLNRRIRSASGSAKVWDALVDYAATDNGIMDSYRWTQDKTLTADGTHPSAAGAAYLYRGYLGVAQRLIDTFRAS